MNPTHLLRDMHKTILGLFRQAEALDARVHEMKEGVIRETLMELEIYQTLEEECLYPEFKSAAGPSEGLLIDRLQATQQSIQNLVGEIRELPLGDVRFNEKFQDLIDRVELHFEEEKNELYPCVDQLLPKNFSKMTEQMQNRKSELLKSPRFAKDKPEVVQNPHGGEQSRIRKTA